MDNHRIIPAGGLDLSAPPVPIKEVRLLPVAMLDAQPGGLSEKGAIGHVRLVDLPNLTAYLVPINAALAVGLRGQLQDVLDNADQSRDPDQPQGDRSQ